MARNSRYNACNVGRLARRYLDAVPPPIPGGPFSIREPFDATSRLPSNPCPWRRGHPGRRLGPRRERATCPARRLSGAWRPAAAAPAAGRRAPRPRAAAAAARSPPAAAARSRLCLGRWLLGLARWPLCVGAGALDRGAARTPLELGTMAPAGPELGVRAGRLALSRQGTAPCAMRNTLYIVCVELTPPSAVEAAFPRVATPAFGTPARPSSAGVQFLASIDFAQAYAVARVAPPPRHERAGPRERRLRRRIVLPAPACHAPPDRSRVIC